MSINCLPPFLVVFFFLNLKTKKSRQSRDSFVFAIQYISGLFLKISRTTYIHEYYNTDLKLCHTLVNNKLWILYYIFYSMSIFFVKFT